MGKPIVCNPPGCDCNQGRSCPVREACQLAEFDRLDSDGRSLLRWLLAAVALCAACVVLALLFGGPK